MFEELEQAIPVQWKGLFRVIVLPVSWLPSFQGMLLNFSWNSYIDWVVPFKRIFLAMPALGIVLGMWCSMLAVYTLAFRNNRIRFVGAIIVAWWDILRCTWFFWAGMGKFLWMAFGALWGLIRLFVSVILELIRESFELPFVLTGTIARNFRQPGVPWLAFLITLIWVVLEATIFTYILNPTITEIVTDMTGSESHPYLPYVLFTFLLVVIAGSFACMHALLEAVEKKDIRNIVWMVIVELFVMGVETLFLYRELVDAISPWLAQQTGWEMGFASVLIFSCGGWLGIRAMAWFLFARFGTPTLLAIIARQRLTGEETEAPPTAQAEERWGVVLGKLREEQDWFQKKGEALLTAAVLPVFQVIAAGLNFGFVLFVGRSVFTLPFKSLSDVAETRGLLELLVGAGGRE